MNGYLIKATYLTGPHTGKSYFLRKGGYVTQECDTQWEDTVYKSESMCNARCKKLSAQNSSDYYIESCDRANRRFAGKEVARYRIHEKMTYEPYLVSDVHIYNI